MKNIPATIICFYLQFYLTNALIDLSTCSITKGCYRFPKDCTSGSNCKSIVTWAELRPGFVTMELVAPTQYGYVSVCMSTDKVMANDDCIDCMNGASVVSLRHSFNTGQSNNPTGITDGLYINSSSKAGGEFSCTFERILVSSTNPDKMFDLKNPYFLMLAVGEVVGNGIKLKHSDKSLYEKKILLTEIKEISSSKIGHSKLVKAHGSLMAAAWLLCATLGMFIARYLKAGWPGKKVTGLPMWFFLHRVLMMLAVLLSSLGFILIFVHVKAYSTSTTDFFKSHPPIGIAVMALALLNPIMTIFRCDAGNDQRWLFNWAHYIVGNVALILGFVNCYSGYTYLKGDGQNLVVAYGGFYVFMTIFMEIHVYCSRRTAKREIDMSIDMDSNHQTETKPKKKSHVRHIAFVIFALVTLAVYIGLLLFILL